MLKIVESTMDKLVVDETMPSPAQLLGAPTAITVTFDRTLLKVTLQKHFLFKKSQLQEVSLEELQRVDIEEDPRGYCRVALMFISGEKLPLNEQFTPNKEEKKEFAEKIRLLLAHVLRRSKNIY